MQSAEGRAFLTNNSVVSREPGVTFVSGVSGDVDCYGTVFSSIRHPQIVREAGNQITTRGHSSPYTRI